MSGEKCQGRFWFTWYLKSELAGENDHLVYLTGRMMSNVSEVPSSAVSMGSEIEFMQDCSGEL